MEFKNKLILITGSTSGVGQGLAKELLKEGANVIINYANSDENVNQTRELLKEYENNLLVIKADVSNEQDVVKMYQKIEDKYGKLDCIVNNAAYDKVF